MWWNCLADDRCVTAESRSTPQLIFHIMSLSHCRHYWNADTLRCCSLLIEWHWSAANIYLRTAMISRVMSLFPVSMTDKKRQECDRRTPTMKKYEAPVFVFYILIQGEQELSGNNTFWLFQPSIAKTTYRFTPGDKQVHRPTRSHERSQ